MSHFTVLVVAQDTAAALQPYHEFECTGTNDQYVQDIDKTEEARESFAEDTSTRIKAPDGTLHSFFDEKGEWRPEFSQVEVGAPAFDRGRKTYYVPPGYEKVEVPTSQVQKFADYAADYYGWEILRPGEDADLEDKHKYGYVQLDAAGEVVKCIDRTNPNKKWDWWQLGGRWSGKLVLKNGQRADEALAGDVDWSAMIAAAADRAANQYDKIKAIVGDRQVTTWADLLKKHEAGEITIEAARDFYHGQPVIEELKKAEAIDFFDGAETLSKVMATGRDDYIKRESETKATTWAMLHNGEWLERGRMGWFAMSDATDESTDEFATKFWETMRALPAEAKVAVVDCHI